MAEIATNGSSRSVEEAEQQFYDWLFLKTLEDIANRVLPGHDRYTILGIAPLLRKLLLDEKSLLSLVARKHRKVKIGFSIRPYAPPATTPTDIPTWKEVYSRGQLVDSVDRSVSLSRLLATPVARFRGQTHTYKEMLRHYAHMEGGVHLLTPKDDMGHVLRMTSGILLDQETYFIDLLQDMGTVIIRGMDPLKAAVIAQRSE